MNPIIVISDDPAAKAAMESRIKAAGFEVEKERVVEPSRETIELLTTPAAFDAVKALDETFIGTPNYMGLAWFWEYDYRHALRDCTREQRVAVHDAFIAARLNVAGNSEAHTNIVARLIPGWMEVAP